MFDSLLGTPGAHFEFDLTVWKSIVSKPDKARTCKKIQYIRSKRESVCVMLVDLVKEKGGRQGTKGPARSERDQTWLTWRGTVVVTNLVSSPILETLSLLRDLVDPEVPGIFPLRVVFARIEKG